MGAWWQPWFNLKTDANELANELVGSQTHKFIWKFILGLPGPFIALVGEGLSRSGGGAPWHADIILMSHHQCGKSQIVSKKRDLKI